MASRSINSRMGDLKDSVKGFLGVQHQRSMASDEPPRQERLNTKSMVKVLVIGETGSGKSTFINYLTNYFKKGTLQDLKIAIPSTFHPVVTENFAHHEHDVNDKTQSKTDSCNQYMFTDNNIQYLFVDTPGLSDTRGAEQDKINLSKIIDAVENLAGLTAVIIVVNGAIARLTVNLRNVIAQLRGNLPDIVMDNVVVILTNTTRHTVNFSLKALELSGNVYPYFMQNSAFSTDPSKWTSTAMQSLQQDWDRAMNELEAMVTTLTTFKTKSVSAFKNMKDIRNSIKALMHAARLEVVQIQKMQDEIAMFEAGLQQSKADTVTYKDYTKERVVDKVEIVDAKYHSTLCQNCNHVCHNNCGLDETTTAGAQIFQQCWAMSNGNCKQCPNKCSYTAHYHAKKTVQVTQQKLKDVLADIKNRYDSASKNSSEFQTKITSAADAKKLLEKALQQKNKDIIAKCNELRQICSGFNLAAELHALIDQLEIEAAMLRNVDARKQAEVFIRSLKDFCASIEKDQNTQQTKHNQTSTMNIIDTEQHVEGQKPYQPENTLNSSVQDRNTSAPKSGSSNSGSYASDEVLNQIRALSGGSSKTKKKKKDKESLKENVESTDGDDQSEEDNSDESTPTEVKPKPTKKKPSKVELPHVQVNSSKPDVEEFKKLSTTELITRYRTCGDQHISNFIINELKQRSLGKSMAPLNDPADIARFMTSTQKYCSLDYTSLKHVYDQLKEQICAITEPDVLEIEKVSSTLLYEIAAVHQLLKSSSSSSNPGVVNSSFTAQQQPPSFHQQQQPMPPYQQLYPQLPYHQQYRTGLNPIPPYHPQQQYQQNYPMSGAPYLSVDPYYHMQHPSRFPHPTSDLSHGRESIRNSPRQYEHFPPHDPQYHMQTGGSADRYRQSPMHMDNEHFRRRETDSPMYYNDPNPSSRSSSAHSPHHHPQVYQQHAFPNVTSPPSTLPMTAGFESAPGFGASHLSNTFDKMRVTSPFRPIEPSINRSDANSPRSRSSSGFSEINSRANSSVGLPFESSAAELRKNTNTQLLATYNEAIQKKNRAYEHAIYSELQRRCYGDYPLLIQEERTLFDDKCNFFRKNSSEELRKSQEEVRYKIRGYLNDDAANINNIPLELIVEAAALNHLIETSRFN